MEKNFRLWRQYADEWNEEEMWPEAEYPYATSRYLVKSGCFVTSLSIMLRRYGLEKEEDVERFNPVIFCKKLQKIGAYDQYADMLPEDVSRLYPIDYLGTVPFSSEVLVDCLKSEQPSLVMVPGVNGVYHYVVPDALDEKGVRVCDPGFDKEYLSELGTAYFIVRFRKRSFCTDNTVKFFRGSIFDTEEQMKAFGIPAGTSMPERDILVKAFEKWGGELAKNLPGDYVASIRNTVEKKVICFRSTGAKEEMPICKFPNGKFLYGSEQYITSSKAYCEEPVKPIISYLQPGECVEFDERKK